MAVPGSLLLMGGIPSNHSFASRLLPFAIAGAGKGPEASRATSCACCVSSAAAFVAAAVVFSSTAVALPPPEDAETFSNVPQLLSGDDKKQLRIQRPKSRAAEKCTSKCVGTCIRGGAGSPGEGPFNVRSCVIFFLAHSLRDIITSFLPASDLWLFSRKDSEADSIAWWNAQTYATSSRMEKMAPKSHLTTILSSLVEC